MRYRATVATDNVDAFGYQFTPAVLDRLERDAVGKSVYLMFAQEVGKVVSSSRGDGRVSVLFESDKDVDDLSLVPSFLNEKLEKNESLNDIKIGDKKLDFKLF